jgi:endonuclease/exonuclease/phosphatase family metal-dependent hydrolase
LSELATAGLGSRLKYHALDPEPRAQGTAIYSRFPLRRPPTPDFVFKMARAEATMPGETAGKGLDATFPADGSLFPPPITIDHILADERFGIVSYEVEPLPNSDHHAIFAELALPGPAG